VASKHHGFWGLCLRPLPLVYFAQAFKLNPMHTSYEQRLEFLHQFLEGAEVFHTNITNGALIKGDGWEVSSVVHALQC